eukprot:8885493-Alexandrium_andersonii.AAC.1
MHRAALWVLRDSETRGSMKPDFRRVLAGLPLHAGGRQFCNTVEGTACTVAAGTAPGAWGRAAAATVITKRAAGSCRARRTDTW